MRLSAVLCALVTPGLITATALTYRLSPSETACFYTWVDTPGSKVAFYFAVRSSFCSCLITFHPSKPQPSPWVQAGGSFDLDYNVLGPNDRTVMEATKERQGDFVFTAKEVGEYRVCFDNDMSTFSEKTVDFEITV
jgi:hypothetical protein